MWRMDGIKTSSAVKPPTWSDVIKLQALSGEPPPSLHFKPCPAVPVKAEGENPHNPNQHGEVRIIGEE